MSLISSQRPDGSWGPACPEPLWIGWRLRKARCDCGEAFKGREKYQAHWFAVHAQPSTPGPGEDS